MQFNTKLANKKNNIKDKCDFLLASDANMAWGWIVGGGDNNKKVLQDLIISVNYNEGEFVRLPCFGSKIVVKELDENDFERAWRRWFRVWRWSGQRHYI